MRYSHHARLVWSVALQVQMHGLHGYSRRCTVAALSPARLYRIHEDVLSNQLAKPGSPRATRRVAPDAGIRVVLRHVGQCAVPCHAGDPASRREASRQARGGGRGVRRPGGRVSRIGGELSPGPQARTVTINAQPTREPRERSYEPPSAFQVSYRATGALRGEGVDPVAGMSTRPPCEFER